MRRIVYALFVFLALGTLHAYAQRCIGYSQQSILDDFFEAEIVAVCGIKNAVKPNNDLRFGQVEMTLDDILRPHAILKGRKSIVISHYFETTSDKWMVAMDVYKGKIDPYKGVQLDAKGEMERFIRGALKLKDKSHVGRAQYAAGFLFSPNDDVAKSALAEITRPSYGELRKIAESLKPEPLAKAIQDKKTPALRVEVYGLLLGHCGTKDHAALIRKRLDDGKNLRERHGLLLIGYVLLDRTKGWQIVCDAIADKNAMFEERNSALQTARLIYTERKDVIAEKTSLALVASALEMPDLADFAVEDMARWKRWEHCDKILALPSKAGFDKSDVVRNSVLRFALQCPTQQAKDYVKVQRARDPELVDETQELLELELKDDDAQKKKGS